MSLALLGGFFGAMVAGPLSDRFGRKPLIIVSDVLFIVGFLTIGMGQKMEILMVGRFVEGLGLGVDLMIVPLYLSEVAPIEIRGVMVGCFVTALTLG